MDIKNILGFLTIDQAKVAKGSRHWKLQRVSAVVVLVTAIYLFFNMANLFRVSYSDAIGWISNPINATAMLIFVWASFYHLSKGVEMIIEDYVNHDLAKKIIPAINWAAAILALIGMTSVIRSCGV